MDGEDHATQERLKERTEKAGIVLEEFFPPDEDEPSGKAEYPSYRLARKSHGSQPCSTEEER